MPEGCPLIPELGDYKEGAIPSRCLGCIALAQEMDAMREVSSEVIRLKNADPNAETGIFKVSIIPSIVRPSASPTRIYCLTNYLQQIEHAVGEPFPVHLTTYEFDCCYDTAH